MSALQKIINETEYRYGYLSIISDEVENLEADWLNHRNDQILDIKGNNFKSTKGISALNKLIYLYISSKKLSDLEEIDQLVNLQQLSINDSEQLVSLAGIEKLTKLYHLYLSGTKIQDISQIKNLTNLRIVDLDYDEKLINQLIECSRKLHKLQVVNIIQTNQFVNPIKVYNYKLRYAQKLIIAFLLRKKINYLWSKFFYSNPNKESRFVYLSLFDLK